MFVLSVISFTDVWCLCSLTLRLHSFVGSAREQYEKLDLLHKNMEKQYSDLGDYFVFNTKKISIEEFFGDLNNFKNMFQVCEHMKRNKMNKDCNVRSL